MSRKKEAGFTLIELVITMAIIAILTTIALPAYQGSVRKSRRTEAITTLLDIQLRQEKWRTNHSAYGSLDDIRGIKANDYYNFSVEPETNTYKIQAKAKEGTDQLSDKEKSEPCSTLTLYQTGKKCPEVCWWGKETSEECSEE